ncbi:Sin3 histone deacetylase corepressor complex component SDS3, partial [Heterocephalus glaber]
QHEELESTEDEERSCWGHGSEEDTEDASETDLAKYDEDHVEMKGQMYQGKLASLKRQLKYLLTDEQIMEDLRTLNKFKSPKRPASPSSPEQLPATPVESPAQRLEAQIEDGKLYYDKRWYHKSQAIYLESKDNQKLRCMISSVGSNESWVRKASDSTKMKIYLGQLQHGLFVIHWGPVA